MNRIIYILVIMCLVLGIYFMFRSGSLFGLYLGVVIGVISSVAFYALHEVVTKIKYPDAIISSANQNNELELNIPYDKAFDLCKQSIGAFRGSRLLKSEQKTGIIFARIGMSFYSWGESITINISKLNGEKVNIMISSKSILVTQIFDWGKNYENIKKIRDFLLEKG